MDVTLGCIFLLGDAGGPTGSPGGFPEATLMGWGAPAPWGELERAALSPW